MSKDRRHFVRRLHGGFEAATQNFDGVVSSFHTRGQPVVVRGAASSRFRRVPAEVLARLALGAGERPFGSAANLPSIRPRKPTDDDMGPHN